MSEAAVPEEGPFKLELLPDDPDYTAPDGSEIRELIRGRKGSLAHCTLPPGQTSKAVKHRDVEELWYVPCGTGEVWRAQGEYDRPVPVSPGTSLAVPSSAHFQFKNTGDVSLELIIATVPPWPGSEEADGVESL